MIGSVQLRVIRTRINKAEKQRHSATNNLETGRLKTGRLNRPEHR